MQQRKQGKNAQKKRKEEKRGTRRGIQLTYSYGTTVAHQSPLHPSAFFLDKKRTICDADDRVTGGRKGAAGAGAGAEAGTGSSVERSITAAEYAPRIPGETAANYEGERSWTQTRIRPGHGHSLGAQDLGAHGEKISG